MNNQGSLSPFLSASEPHQRAEEETLRGPDPKADRQMLDEARWVRSLPEDLSREE